MTSVDWDDLDLDPRVEVFREGPGQPTLFLKPKDVTVATLSLIVAEELLLERRGKGWYM